MKVGDKVRLTKHQIGSDENYEIGSVFTIKDEYRLGFWNVEENDHYWGESQLELVSSEENITLKELPNTVVNTKTREEYDQLMKIYEDFGWVWLDGDKPTSYDGWSGHEEETCIYAKNRFGYSRSGFYESEGRKILSLQEFLEEQGLDQKEEFLVGDKVVITGNTGPYHFFEIGTVCEVRGKRPNNFQLYGKSKIGDHKISQHVSESDFKKYTPETSSTIRATGSTLTMDDINEAQKVLSATAPYLRHASWGGGSNFIKKPKGGIMSRLRKLTNFLKTSLTQPTKDYYQLGWVEIDEDNDLVVTGEGQEAFIQEQMIGGGDLPKLAAKRIKEIKKEEKNN